MKFAVVDTETTGGKPDPDRLTEIGIVLLDDMQRVGEFQTLINPERPIPPFVQNLTGISNKMVAEAPVFADVAKQIRECLADRIFVAHNVAFDFGFVRRELEMCGYPFSAPRLCTVRLTRQAFPGYPSYSLSKIATELGITGWDHHRALGDANAAASLLQLSWDKIGEAGILAQTKGFAPPALLPHGWNSQRLAKIPALPGVLRILGSQGQLLYVTEANHLLEKTTELLSNPAKRGPLASIKKGIADLDYEVTGSLLLAKLIACQEILQKKPSCNRQIRIPVDTGANLRDQVLVQPGRSMNERAALVVKHGRLLGYAWFDQDESLNQEELEDRLEPLDMAGNLAPLLKQLRAAK